MKNSKWLNTRRNRTCSDMRRTTKEGDIMKKRRQRTVAHDNHWFAAEDVELACPEHTRIRIVQPDPVFVATLATCVLADISVAVAR